MKDKEKQIFEEWFEEKKEKCEVYGNGDDFWVDDEIKKFCLMGYEQGLKAGRPQFHDLLENPNDLPKKLELGTCSKTVVNQIGTPCHYNYVLQCWQNWSFIPIQTPIAWCEIPTFDKESE